MYIFSHSVIACQIHLCSCFFQKGHWYFHVKKVVIFLLWIIAYDNFINVVLIIIIPNVSKCSTIDTGVSHCLTWLLFSWKDVACRTAAYHKCHDKLFQE